MSLINVFLSPSQALIGVDTEAVNHRTGEFMVANKMIHLAHLNVVMAGRGTQGFLLVLFTMASQIQVEDFDSLANVMPLTIEGAYNAIGAHKAGDPDLHFSDEQEIVLAGWSALHGRMRAVCYRRNSPAHEIEIIEIEDPGYMMPWSDKWGEPPEGDGRRGMFDLALAQTKNAKRESPGVAMGGRLLIAELMRGGMSFTSIDGLTVEENEHDGVLTFSVAELQALSAGNVGADLADKMRRAGGVQRAEAI